MQPTTHPQDHLRLANQRGAELQKAAADQRLMAQERSHRRAERAAEGSLVDPTWPRRILAAGAAAIVILALGIGIGALSSDVDATTTLEGQQQINQAVAQPGFQPGPNTPRMQ